MNLNDSLPLSGSHFLVQVVSKVLSGLAIKVPQLRSLLDRSLERSQPFNLSAHQLLHHDFLQHAHPPSFISPKLALARLCHQPAGPASPCEGLSAHLLAGSKSVQDRHVHLSLKKLQHPKGFAATSGPLVPPKRKVFQCGPAAAWLFGNCSSSAKSPGTRVRLQATLPRMHSARPYQSEARILEGRRGRGGAARRTRNMFVWGIHVEVRVGAGENGEESLRPASGRLRSPPLHSH